MTREQIFQTLFLRLTSGGNFKTIGRRVIHWSQVPNKPALFLRHSGDVYGTRRTGMPVKVTLVGQIWLYSDAGADPDVAPDIGLNHEIEIVEALLKPPPGFEAQTLGGLVTHCWLENESKKYPGDLGGNAIAIMPVYILAPGLGGN